MGDVQGEKTYVGDLSILTAPEGAVQCNAWR